MECERCKKSEATIHLTEIIKDVKSELHLCESCAKEVGLNAKLSNFSLSMPEMLSFLDLSEIDGSTDDIHCRSCNHSFFEYGKTGMLGCPDCYDSFRESLAPVIAGYHGEVKHIGKSPRYSADSFKETVLARNTGRDSSMDDLKKELEAAVTEERYEDAAVLRDRLKVLMNKDA